MERKKGSSVERVLQIVEEVAKATRPLSAGDLSEILDIPKPSMHRLLQQLQETGFLRLDLQGRVVCGERTHKLVFHVWKNGAYKSDREAVLQRLSQHIGETVGISILDRLSVVYIDRVLSNWPLQINLPEGMNVPIWASASGKLLLAQMPTSSLQRVIENLEPYALTKNTIVHKADLLASIKQIKKQGFAVDDEEFIPGMVACAVPIINPERGEIFATLFTHAPSVRKSLSELQAYIPAMQEAAQELSQLFSKMK
ncbi:IclR family transcriptional regulator [Pelistega suis]|uniref:IclR family transcriptional regulator n=1 Tax=Pelistega suis TaxID=1631957 RepID=UPI00211BCC22|nr:IclR family transcriptional regulator [Pelistega suis]MCQ9329699.1 IclR family transcriptional regulator [Pelistega suis]MDY3331563.1 IclR family transcriptional regulator [Pelistega sp.]